MLDNDQLISHIHDHLHDPHDPNQHQLQFLALQYLPLLLAARPVIQCNLKPELDYLPYILPHLHALVPVLTSQGVLVDF